MEAKKVSFGFSKVSKKPIFVPSLGTAKESAKKELIKCLEGQEIKLVNEKKEEAPLIIPMKENQKTPAALASLMKRRAVLLEKEETNVETERKVTNAFVKFVESKENDLEKRAASEILAELSNEIEESSSSLSLPVVKPDDLPLDGAKEPTFDDYESIPVQQFGKAMLRGMGWTEPPEKKIKLGVDDDMPLVRPKGMGLGADKALKVKPLLVAPEENEVLEIKKQAFVRILGGKHKDAYGQIEGFDDEACRIIVKMSIGGAKEAFNEFLCQPVSRKEFSQYGKCINTAKYEEYKKFENEHDQTVKKKEKKGEYVPKVERKEHKIQEESNKDKRISDQRSDYDNKQEYYGSVRKNEEDRRLRRERDQQRRYSPNDVKAGSSSNSSTRRPHSGVDGSRTKSSSPGVNSRYGKKCAIRADESTDTSESSESDSDSDSAYERSHKKKSCKDTKKKKSKSRKSKNKTKHSRHRLSSPDGESDSNYIGRQSDRKNKSSHKKKTKKSKKQRSRSPSRI